MTDVIYLGRDQANGTDTVVAVRRLEDGKIEVVFVEQAATDTWLYGIVLGWESLGDLEHNKEVMEELAEKHDWSPATVARLRRLRKRYGEAFPCQDGRGNATTPASDHLRKVADFPVTYSWLIDPRNIAHVERSRVSVDHRGTLCGITIAVDTDEAWWSARDPLCNVCRGCIAELDMPSDK